MSQEDDKPPHRQPVAPKRRGGWMTPGEAKEAIGRWLARLESKEPKPSAREPGDDDPEAA